MIEPTTPSWRKSTRSGAEGACVEVAGNLVDQVLVRDTKDRDGGILTFRPDAWRAFLAEPPRRP